MRYKAWMWLTCLFCFDRWVARKPGVGLSSRSRWVWYYILSIWYSSQERRVGGVDQVLLFSLSTPRQSSTLFVQKFPSRQAMFHNSVLQTHNANISASNGEQNTFFFFHWRAQLHPWVTSDIVPISPGPLQSPLFSICIDTSYKYKIPQFGLAWKNSFKQWTNQNLVWRIWGMFQNVLIPLAQCHCFRHVTTWLFQPENEWKPRQENMKDVPTPLAESHNVASASAT